MKSRRIRKGRVVFLAVLLFLLFFGLGNLCTYFWKNGFSVNNDLFKPKSADRVILLIGVDARDPKEPSRSDTIMLVFLHPKENRIDLLSVPRDSRVSIEGESYKRKINYAHAKGGPELLQKTLQDCLNVKINGYMELDFSGFEKVIDQMGGVEINVEKRMYTAYEGIDLYPGLQRLNGHDALAYVRFRHDGMGDIGRIQRQQKFLRAVSKQALTFHNIVNSPALLGEIMDNIKTDMGTGAIASLARQFVSQPEVNSYMVPGEAEMVNDASYWVVNWSETEKLVEELKNPPASNAESSGNKQE
jgi:LCP family protein required for cell wall assembly